MLSRARTLGKEQIHRISKEFLIHLFLWVLYFVVLAYEKYNPNVWPGIPSHLQFSDFVLTFNYFLLILVINYLLLPRYLYQERCLTFFSLFIAAITITVLIEEFVLEPLLLPGTIRGDQFPGFIYVFLRVGPTVLFFLGFKLAWDNLQTVTTLEQVEKEKSESQLQFLKSQLNPHFLFNNLNILFSYAQEASPKTPEIILQLSAIMRYMLNESKDNLVPLSRELAYLRDFVSLQELQMEDRGQVKLVIKGDSDSRVIAPMIFLGFVENCFKHSLGSQAEDIFIRISIEVLEDELIFTSTNSYKEKINSSNDSLAKGIGLENVCKRLELQYPDKHQLIIRNENNLYHVFLRLELPGNGV